MPHVPAIRHFAAVAFDECRIVSVRDETDFLAIGFVRNRKLILAGDLAHLRLAEISQGENGPGKLFLVQLKQEIRLVFFLVVEPASGETARSHHDRKFGRNALSPFETPRPLSPCVPGTETSAVNCTAHKERE